MICKYCGQKMDPSDAVCPHCHNPATPLIGGNGFWDMGKDPNAAPAAPQQHREVPVPPAAKKSGKSSPSRGIAVLALVLSIVSIVLAAWNSFSTRAALKEQQQAQDNQVSIISHQTLEIQKLKAFLSELQDQIEDSTHHRPQIIITRPDTFDIEGPQSVVTEPVEPTWPAEETSPAASDPTVPSSEASAATELPAESSLSAAENYAQTEVPHD